MENVNPPLANVVTLGATDFDRLRSFYRELGWPQAIDGDDYVVFELRGLALALFPVEKLAADGRRKPERGSGGVRFTIAFLVPTPEDVDRTIEHVRAAGGTITKEPADAEFFRGRSAYFADLEWNFWEVAWAPPDNPVVAAAHRAAGLVPSGHLQY